MMDDITSAIKNHTRSLNILNDLSLADLYGIKGKLELTRGDQMQAIADLESAIKLDPIGKVFGSHEGSFAPNATSTPCEWNTTDLDGLVRKFPNDHRVYLFRALYYKFNAFWHSSDHNDAKYYAMALADIKKAIELNPTAAFAYYLLGDNIQDLQDLQALAPGKERYSQSHEPSEDDRKILQAYDMAIARDAKLVPAYVARANILWSLRIYDRAIRDYTKAIELDPEDPDYYDSRALLYMKTAKYASAVADFSLAIEKDETSTYYGFYEHRGDANKMLGDLEAAISDYSHAMRRILEPRIPYSITMNTFRALYPEYNELSDEALARKLHTIFDPNWDYSSFVKQFMATSDGTAPPHLATIYFSRGDAYWQGRQYRRAVREYQRALLGFRKWTDRYPALFDRWQLVSKSSESEVYLDVRTVEYSEVTRVKL